MCAGIVLGAEKGKKSKNSKYKFITFESASVARNGSFTWKASSIKIVYHLKTVRQR